MTTLFLVMVSDCERSEIVSTHVTFEGALGAVQGHPTDVGLCRPDPVPGMPVPTFEHEEGVSVRAVGPGPGRGVVVASWTVERPGLGCDHVWPCDGEGPPAMDVTPFLRRML